MFLFDVDNTLFDNDAVVRDYRAHLERECGREAADRYWKIFEALRSEVGYADYLGALQRYRLSHRHNPRLLLLSSFLLDYPFADRLYSGALDVVAYAGRLGPAVILSDGDVVFQPRKIERSGLRRAVEDRVLICIHKEDELGEIERIYPAKHYVLVDDKPRILGAVKRAWGPRVTTVFVRQGHYAQDAGAVAANPGADVSLATISGLLDLTLPALLGAAAAQGRVNR